MRRWPLFRNRDYMLLWGGDLLSQLGSQTSTVAYPLLVLALTHSPAKAGIVGFAQYMPWVVFALPAGALADRFDRKRLMIACDCIRGIAAGSIVLALLVAQPPYLQIAAVAFLDGALLTLSYICERGALRQVVPPDQLQDAVSQNEARTFSASITGPPLGGVLFSLSRLLPFVADTISFFCSIIALSLTRSSFQPATAGRPPEQGPSTAGIADGFRWLWRHPFFRVTALLFGAANPVFTGLYLLAILLAKGHGATSAEVGIMFAIAGLGGVLGAISTPWLRRRIRPGTAVAAANWLLAAVLPLLLFAHAAILIGMIIAAAEFPTPLAIASVGGVRVAAAPEHMQGRVQAAATLIGMSITWLGPLAIGFAFQQMGATGTIILLLVWTLILATAATVAPALRATHHIHADHLHYALSQNE